MLEKLEPIVRRAGEIVLSARGAAVRAREKTSAADLVTEYDLAVEAYLKEALPPLCPGAVFCGEEEAENADPARGWAFIVDPIDGTANFVRGMMHSAVSVALAKDGETRFGAVYDPYADEYFSAGLGQGASLNGRPIHVSDTPLEKGVFGMGTAIYLREYWAPTARLTDQLMARACDLRRFGAASLDLCAVACGRTDAFFEYSLCPWDYAAGALIVSEAGGAVCSLTGGPLPLDRRSGVWASNRVNRHILDEVEI